MFLLAWLVLSGAEAIECHIMQILVGDYKYCCCHQTVSSAKALLKTSCKRNVACSK